MSSVDIKLCMVQYKPLKTECSIRPRARNRAVILQLGLQQRQESFGKLKYDKKLLAFARWYAAEQVIMGLYYGAT